MKRPIAALVFAAALATTGSTVNAGPGWSTTFTYYSDATYTEEVGFRIHTCQGRNVRSGIQTNFVTVSEEPC